jgi:hypothetical protein
MNIILVFGTLHENAPISYRSQLPKFCKNTITIDNIEIKKYTNAGLHNSFKDFGKAIM